MNYPDSKQINIALIAEILYLLNLLFLPGIAFLLLLTLFLVKRQTGSALAKNHLKQTLGVSLFGGGILVIMISFIIFIGGVNSAYAWICALLYFTTIHCSLILMGVWGLVKALNEEAVSYPLIGRWL